MTKTLRKQKSFIHLKQSSRVQKGVLNNTACQTITGYLQQAAAERSQGVRSVLPHMLLGAIALLGPELGEFSLPAS